MKIKLVTIILFVFLSNLIPIYVINAQTSTSTLPVDTTALIRQLQALVLSLQTQIQELRAKLETTRGEIETVKTEIKELKLTRSLQRGVTGDDVRELQEFLSTQYPDLYPAKQITGYFGPATEAAVKKLQEQQGIESVGIVGPKTIAKLKELVISSFAKASEDKKGAGESDKIPPGLIHAPGIQEKLGITKEEGVLSPMPTPAGIIPAIPAQPIRQTGTTTIPAIPAIPATTTAATSTIITPDPGVTLPPPTETSITTTTTPTPSLTPSPTPSPTSTTTNTSLYDFFLYVNDGVNSKTITQGSSATFGISWGISVGSQDSSHNVTFGAIGVAGAIYSFSPSSCVTPCATIITVVTTSATPAGTYTVTVTGTRNGVSRSTTASVTVSPPPPPPPSSITEIQITTNSAKQESPAISGNKIVWDDERNGGFDKADIYLYDLDTHQERQISTSTGREFEPAISGNRIVYTDTRPDPNKPGYNISTVHLYDLTNDTDRELKYRAHINQFSAGADISGDRVAYLKYEKAISSSGYIANIFLYDLTTNTEKQITQITQENDNPSHLSTAGNYIAWMNGSGGAWKIYSYDLTTNTQRLITPYNEITGYGGFQMYPAVSAEGKIAMMDSRIGTRANGSANIYDVYLYDLNTNTEKRLTPQSGAASPTDISISGNYVVWSVRNSTSDHHIYLYNLSTNKLTQLTSYPSEQFRSFISGNKVVWVDTRNKIYGDSQYQYNNDIYYADISNLSSSLDATNNFASILQSLSEILKTLQKIVNK